MRPVHTSIGFKSFLCVAVCFASAAITVTREFGVGIPVRQIGSPGDQVPSQIIQPKLTIAVLGDRNGQLMFFRAL